MPTDPSSDQQLDPLDALTDGSGTLANLDALQNARRAWDNGLREVINMWNDEEAVVTVLDKLVDLCQKLHNELTQQGLVRTLTAPEGTSTATSVRVGVADTAPFEALLDAVAMAQSNEVRQAEPDDIGGSLEQLYVDIMEDLNEAHRTAAPLPDTLGDRLVLLSDELDDVIDRLRRQQTAADLAGRIRGVRRPARRTIGHSDSPSSGNSNVVIGDGTLQASSFGPNGMTTTSVIPQPTFETPRRTFQLNGGEITATAAELANVTSISMDLRQPVTLDNSPQGAPAAAGEPSPRRGFGKRRRSADADSARPTAEQSTAEQAVAALEAFLQADGRYHLPAGTILGDLRLLDESVVDRVDAHEGNLVFSAEQGFRAQTLDGRSTLHYIEEYRSPNPYVGLGTPASPDLTTRTTSPRNTFGTPTM
jgi:hypothetical protein